MRLSHFFSAIAVVAALSAGCQKSVVEDATPQGAAATAKDIIADTAKTGRFTYFSFKDNNVVTGADTASAKWDIAFNGTTIWVNGGANRYGQGGAIVLKAQTYDALTQAPATGYQVDTSATQLAIPVGSGKGWYIYNPATFVITPDPGVVLVIRTGDGKYAKMQITSYYKGSPAQPDQNSLSRFYSFKYFYQPNGTNVLQ